MKREDQVKAIEICMNHRATIEFHPVVENMVRDNYLGMVYGCPAVINKLIENGFSLSMSDGHILIDKY